MDRQTEKLLWDESGGGCIPPVAGTRGLVRPGTLRPDQDTGRSATTSEELTRSILGCGAGVTIRPGRFLSTCGEPTPNPSRAPGVRHGACAPSHGVVETWLATGSQGHRADPQQRPPGLQDGTSALHPARGSAGPSAVAPGPSGTASGFGLPIQLLPNPSPKPGCL